MHIAIGTTEQQENPPGNRRNMVAKRLYDARLTTIEERGRNILGLGPDWRILSRDAQLRSDSQRYAYRQEAHESAARCY